MFLNLAVFGGNFLRKSNVPEPGRWPLAGVWRLPLPLFGGSKCVKSMLKSICTLRFGRCRAVGRCWEGALTEVPLYTLCLSFIFLLSTGYYFTSYCHSFHFHLYLLTLFLFLSSFRGRPLH